MTNNDSLKNLSDLIESINASFAEFISEADVKSRLNKSAQSRARKLSLKLSKQLFDFRRASINISKSEGK